MSDVVVRMEAVAKRFCRGLKQGMLYTAVDALYEMVGLPIDGSSLRPGEFWGLDDVSLELRRGESIGVVGHNGAGKSTMLKLLSGILLPDRGRIEVTGRVGALIEVGAGFHPLLTGRENIYINGAIMGMSTQEIDRKLDSIVDFSGLTGDILDSPIKSYSTGMYVRLGFSVAIHTDADLLLVDEVLSVGDIRFVGRCRQKIAELRKQGVSIILVSHSLTLVEETCERGMLLVGGKVAASGTAASVLSAYRRSVNQHPVHRQSEEDSLLSFISGDLVDAEGKPVMTVACGDTLYFDLLLSTPQLVEKGRFCIWLLNEEDNQITGAGYQTIGKDLDAFTSGTIRFAVRCQVLPGAYRLGITFHMKDEYAIADEFAPCSFTVVARENTFSGRSGIYMLDLKTISYTVEKAGSIE